MKKKRHKELKKKKLEESKEDLFSKLPIDIIFDILTRLPLRTISTCRWVSKSWYNLILHPRFAQLHFIRYNDDLPCAIFPTRSESNGKLIDPECLSRNETLATAYDLKLKDFRENFTIKRGCVCVEVVGTVNGLVCFSPDDFELDYEPVPYYVVNPITGDYVLLPKSPKINVKPLGSGFGFDSFKNEYKLIRILHNPSMPRNTFEWDSEDGEFDTEDEDGEATNQSYVTFENQMYETVAKHMDESKDENVVVYGNKVEIYTLGSGTWREVELITNEPSLTIISMRDSNVLLHGCLHWTPQVKIESESSTTIISFNMAKEEFNQIEMSFLSGWCKKKLFNLLVLNKCLCVIDGTFMDGMHVWVLKDYGVDSSWVQEYFIQPKFFHPLWHGYHEVIELKNGELLLVDRETNLIYYDCKRKISKPIMLHDISGSVVHVHPGFHVFFKGSLLSPRAIDSN
ncbi:hypothetical protein ACHQM5_025246 [Ranunculus cassubicifolius]